MKKFLVSLFFTWLGSTLCAQEKVDTFHIANNQLETSWLREGKHSYLVFLEDSAGRKSRFSLWQRNIAFEKRNGRDIIVIHQDWSSTDSTGLRKVVSYVDRKNLAPIYHYTWSPRAGIQAFQFSGINITGVDSVTASTNKSFTTSGSEPTLNWEIDLETFSTLPLREGKAFALNFYHPGSKTAPQFYVYKVTGSEKLTLMNGTIEDCWKLEINYDRPGSSAIFYISKKTHDVLKMEERFGKSKRYKLKIGVSA